MTNVTFFLLTPILIRYFYLKSKSSQVGASKHCTVHSKHYLTSLSCLLLQRSAHSCQLPAFFPVCRVVYNSMSLWGQSSWIRSFGALVVVVGSVVVGVISENESRKLKLYITLMTRVYLFQYIFSAFQLHCLDWIVFWFFENLQI